MNNQSSLSICVWLNAPTDQMSQHSYYSWSELLSAYIRTVRQLLSNCFNVVEINIVHYVHKNIGSFPALNHVNFLLTLPDRLFPSLTRYHFASVALDLASFFLCACESTERHFSDEILVCSWVCTHVTMENKAGNELPRRRAKGRPKQAVFTEMSHHCNQMFWQQYSRIVLRLVLRVNLLFAAHENCVSVALMAPLMQILLCSACLTLKLFSSLLLPLLPWPGLCTRTADKAFYTQPDSDAIGLV